VNDILKDTMHGLHDTPAVEIRYRRNARTPNQSSRFQIFELLSGKAGGKRPRVHRGRENLLRRGSKQGFELGNSIKSASPEQQYRGKRGYNKGAKPCCAMFGTGMSLFSEHRDTVL